MAGKRVNSGRALASALTELGDVVGDKGDVIIQKLTLDGFDNLLRRTPVDTGFLRSRWAISVNSKPATQTVGHPGGETYAQPVTPRFKPKWGDRVYFFNNVEYAYFIEHGTSRNRAQPMIEPTYRYLLNEANRLTKTLSKDRMA
jgi:hypothetical protein